MFLCDWSFGKLYAVHLKPGGASYTGTAEEFVTGQPLALTDIVVNPKDGAMYFAVGGRRTHRSLSCDVCRQQIDSVKPGDNALRRTSAPLQAEAPGIKTRER
jgi:hypothetical protein